MTHPFLAVSQRVAVDPHHGERRDVLDQRWTVFLAACGLTPLPLPNDEHAALALMAAVPIRGVLLTGGNTVGEDAPERDRAEAAMLAFARMRRLPVLGVCHGMQVLLHHAGVALHRVANHAGTSHLVETDAGSRMVNSYHDFGALESGPFHVTARAGDGVIEAIAHPSEPLLGIMWHPERASPFEDVAMVKKHFLGEHA